MRKMKRVLSLILAMVMILSLGATPVQAAGRGQQGWSSVTYGAAESEAENAAEVTAEEPATPAAETEAPAEEPAAPAEEAPEAAEPEAPAEETPEAAEPEAPAEEIEVPAEEAPVEAAPAEEQAPAEETAEEIAAGFGAGEVSSSMSRGSGAAMSLGTALTLALPRLNAKAGESGIAKKTVLDTDGDGIYELALSVTGQSTQTTTSEVQKQNVVIVIDVSGSMNEFYQYAILSNSNNPDSNETYYAKLANGDYVRVYYGLAGLHYGWYYSWGIIRIPLTLAGRLNPVFESTTIYYGQTRLDATKEAAGEMVDTLLAYNTNADSITDMFEISIVKFANKNAVDATSQHVYYNGTETVIHKSTNANAIKAAINNLEAGGGTNWEAALQQAKSEADGELTGTNEKTSIIFMTDGFPTYYGNDPQGYGGESNNTIRESYARARDDARAIVSAGYTLYNVFAFGNNDTYNNHTGYQYLCGLTNYAYGTGDADNFSTTTDAVKNYCFNAQDRDALLATFRLIAALITSNVGYAGVSVTDGVSLGATSTSVVVNGQAKAESMRYTVTDPNTVPIKTVYTVTFKDGKATFVIHNADGSTTTLEDSAPDTVQTTIGDVTKTTQVYSVTVGTGDDAKTYKMSPATIEAGTGMVKWDLSGLGILENYTYTVAFDVWPKQIAYDIAADLNNGIYDDVDAALTAYGVTDATERENIKKALHKNDNGSYSIYTNYEQTQEYYPATAETDDDGNVISVTYGEVQTPEIKQPDPVPLQGSSLDLRKVWDASLSSGEVDEYLWKDGNVGGTSNERKIDLYVWKADTEAALWNKVNSGDTSQAYIHAALGWTGTEYKWEKDVAVAPGMMVNVAEARTLGYDPDAHPENVRTFTNNEGIEKEYYVAEAGHYYYVTEDAEDQDLHFEYDTVLYHPMVVDGKLYNVGFGPNQTVETMDEMFGAVIATNRLKGGLNIDKVVSTTQISVTEADGTIGNVTELLAEDGHVGTVTDEFTYEIKLWKVVNGQKSAVYTYEDQIKDGKTISGSIGYRVLSDPWWDPDKQEIQYGTTARGAILTEESTDASLANGIFATIADNETTITLTMPANGEIRIVNLPAGTQYRVTEILDGTGGYNHAATESIRKEGETLKDSVVTTGETVTGTIKGNTASVEKYYNWAASFYVYHSSDNTIEKISLADPRVKGTYTPGENGDGGRYKYEFNIVNETKKGYLYGGYYKSYAQQKATDAQIIGKVDPETGVVTEGSLEYKTWSAKSDDENYKETETAYDGKHLGGVWADDASDAEPYTGSKATAWKKANVYTTKGTEAEITTGSVYYLKEVPDYYLKPYMSFVYATKIEGQPLQYLRLITAVDDANYSGVGFYVIDDERVTKVQVNKLAATLKISKSDGSTSTLTAKNSFSEVPRGYLSCADQSALLLQDDEYEFNVAQYYTTLDGVTVEGNTLRTINIGNKKFVDDNGKGKAPGFRLVVEIVNNRLDPKPLYY